MAISWTNDIEELEPRYCPGNRHYGWDFVNYLDRNKYPLARTGIAGLVTAGVADALDPKVFSIGRELTALGLGALAGFIIYYALKE